MARTSGLSLIPLRHVYVRALLVIATLSSYASALNFVPGSICEPVCSDAIAGTLREDVSCLDSSYDDLPASHLKDCVTCQLNSTAVDTNTQMTDVLWGLFHLRYALSNCMFAWPEERVSISSPCQVSCAPLQNAVTFHIQNSTNPTDQSPDLGFCTGGKFDDTTINTCAFCYSFIPQQLILGNFLQALHIACHSHPPAGNTFYPDGVAIFNQSTIEGPTGPAAPVASVGLTGSKLVLAIVIPIVGGIAIFAGLCFGCWHFTRKRRAMMAASGRMSKFHDGQSQEYSPMSPDASQAHKFGYNDPPTEMQTISVAPKVDGPSQTQAATQRSSPGVAQGRWSQHRQDEASTPLTTPDKSSHPQGNEVGASSGEVRDPNLHEQYIGGDRHPNVPAETFQAQDGFVKENTQGGWAPKS